jgi:hypothetical protein
VGGHVEGVLRHAQGLGDLLARRGVGLAGQHRSQALEDDPLSLGPVLLAELVRRATDQRQGPVAEEELLGRLRIGGLETVLTIGVLVVDRKHGASATALEGALASFFVGQEVLDRSQQVAAKPAVHRIRAADVPLFEQAREEALSQVAGVFRVVARAADESVDRVPVGFAECGEGFVGGSGIRAHGGVDDAPAGGAKAGAVVGTHATAVSAAGSR